MEPTLAQVLLFAGNFAPRGWAFCHGQLLPINSNQSLYSLLGTNYGGDGRTTFGLPDLRGRVPIHAGQGPGLSNHHLGAKGGENTHTLTIQEIPSHTHTLAIQASTDTSELTDPTGNVVSSEENIEKFAGASDLINMGGPSSTNIAGGSQAHPNMQPTLGLNYIIALQGLFPSRN